MPDLLNNDSEYCRFRAYDMYEGHSWAGGYADNDSGNNQESASESLFSWVSMYLWGVLTENDTYRDAGVFGFTNEMEAVEQYWFDYDKDNWIKVAIQCSRSGLRWN
ncbi:MAG: glycosyl hydrolase [Eubacterium sp.]